jgi:hypothetical protein
MGADKPKAEQTPEINESPFPSLLIWAVVAFLAVALFQFAAFSDEDEAPELGPKEETKLEKRLKEIDDAEQYALIANENGWYPCSHSGRTTYYLLAGEVWKYGTTTKRRFGRYTISELEEKNVTYLIQFRGTISECLKEELRKLFYYPYLPENLARPEKDRLPRPPYNSKYQ